MMVRNARPKGVISAPFGLCFFIFAIVPNEIGRQDVAALVARQPVVTAHWRQHIRASAFGTIHAATFNFSRPVGTAVPQPLSYQLASLDPRMITRGPWHEPADADDPPLPFPRVDRSAKGDRLPVVNPQERRPETVKVLDETPAADPAAAEQVAPPAVEPVESAAVSAEAPVAEIAHPAAAAPEIGPVEPAAVPPEVAVAEPAPPAAAVPEVAAAVEAEATPAVVKEAEAKPEALEAGENLNEDIPDPVDAVVADARGFAPSEPLEPMVEMARLYFGDEPLGDAPGVIEKWAPGEEPTIVAPAAPADPDIKQAALDPAQQPSDDKGGETIAPKGEVTGEGKRPITPAERLHLDGKDRTKAEKCLADAVYFEARGEAVRGQIAVAQVVMNRVFSGFYPRNVCATVYQNKHRRLACQFTFACDGIPDVVTEPHAWVRATRIARDVLDGKYWLAEVDRATHYHAYWVRPSWVREMKRLYKFGVHTFYRPRRWGDGGEVPSWGTAAATSEAIAKL